MEIKVGAGAHAVLMDRFSHFPCFPHFEVERVQRKVTLAVSATCIMEIKGGWCTARWHARLVTHIMAPCYCFLLALLRYPERTWHTPPSPPQVTGAASDADARVVAKSVAGSSLAKAAIFGGDPNWGRIAAAAGYSGAHTN